MQISHVPKVYADNTNLQPRHNVTYTRLQ